MDLRLRLLSVLLLLLSLLQPGVSAQEKYIPQDREELYGTWTNEQNNGDLWHPQRVVVTSDGYTGYSKLSDSVPMFSWKLWIDSKWTDSEGNIWYKALGAGVGRFGGEKSQELYRLSKSATIMERAFVCWRSGEYEDSKYPTRIDPSDYLGYRILYRQDN